MHIIEMIELAISINAAEITHELKGLSKKDTGEQLGDWRITLNKLDDNGKPIEVNDYERLQ